MIQLFSREGHLLTYVTSFMFFAYAFTMRAADTSISSDVSTTSAANVTATWITSDGNASGSATRTDGPGSCPPTSICKNGFEADSCPEGEVCDCSLTGNGTRYFWGATCDRLDLTVTSQTVSRTTVTIVWEENPELRGKYSFVYRKSSLSEDGSVYMEPSQQINGRTVRLVNLDSASATYIVCLMDQDLAGIVYATKNASRLDVKYHDCVLVSSQSSTVWSQQLAFYLICAGMALVLLVIFFVGCVKESLDKRNYHLFDTGMEQEEHEVDDVQDISSDKDDTDNTSTNDGPRAEVAMEVV